MRWTCKTIAGWTLLASATVASAAPHEARLPLHDGKLASADLLEMLHLPAGSLPAGEVDFHGLGSSLLVSAINRSLGEGCRLEVTADAVVLRVDPAKLPRDVDAAKAAVRTFTAVAAPDATAAQARQFGLVLPKVIDTTRPLVLLVHGVDMRHADLASLRNRLHDAGYQTATFDYPGDQPIADDVALLRRHLSAAREALPALKVDVVAFSLGGLVARGYVEAPEYAGNVDRLILIAPPNHGSAVASLELLAKCRQQLNEAWVNPAWRPTWFITSGLGEAGRDLEPKSAFLTTLNALPRRAGVRYTIIDGDEHPFRRALAACVEAPARWVPRSAQAWWGLRQARADLAGFAADVRLGTDGGDGAVSLRSAQLDGVSDVVTVHADHRSIYAADGDQPPLAWATIRDRLAQP